MDFKDLKNKTWIDWVKVIVAIDIAFVGFGLIIDQNIHFLSHIFGFITRIPMGLMYIFIAVLILKRVFPRALHVDPKDTAEVSKLDQDMNDGIRESKHMVKDFFRWCNVQLNQLIDWVDRWMDRVYHFFTRRHREVKQELDILMNKQVGDTPSETDTHDHEDKNTKTS